jgi:hypothetical protein
MGRRFDLGSATQPIQQFIIATLPFFFLLLWFLFETFRRSSRPCYQQNPGDINDDQALQNLEEDCSQLIPLKQFVYFYLGVAFFWTTLALYGKYEIPPDRHCFVIAFLSKHWMRALFFAVSFIIPRRHKLVEAYLTQGVTVIGDVHYTSDNKFGFSMLKAYAHVLYSHPNESSMIKRKVHVYERYTREKAAILYLPGLPTSGQPKADLEIDRDVSEQNRDRLKMLLYYTWIWSLFALLAPIYIVIVIEDLSSESQADNVWQPDVLTWNFSLFYYLFAFVGIPVLSFLINILGWVSYKRWMTKQRQVIEEGGPENVTSTGYGRMENENKSVVEKPYDPPSPTNNEEII